MVFWLLPAVPEAGVVFDPVEGWVAGVELVADALDCRPYVHPKAIRAATGDEALKVQAVIERAIGRERAGVRRQQMDELVFAEREVDIDPVPEGAAGFRLKPEPVAHEALLERSAGLGLDEFD